MTASMKFEFRFGLEERVYIVAEWKRRGFERGKIKRVP